MHPPDPFATAAAAPRGPDLPPAATARPLTCPSCGGSVTLRAAGYSVTVACEYCGSLLDVSNPSVKLLVEDHRARAELDLPLGTRGTLRGIEWEVIGYLRRSEHGSYGWEEYLLFNPYHGYRWLIANRGGWSLGETRTDTPDASYGSAFVDGQMYKPFWANGQAQVDYVLGEFYWRVATGEEVATDDWVRPGFMLSREANANEVSWTVSELLPPKEMEQAFGIRPRAGIWPPLPHQPSPHAAWLRFGWKVAVGAFAALVIAWIVFGSERTLTTQTLAIPRDGHQVSRTIGPITLYRPYQKVEIQAQVPSLDNGWVDLDYSLVNRATQESFQAYGAAERYSGYDSDGSWTEGSRSASISVATVPAGSYDLVIEYKGNRWSGGASSSFTDGAAGTPALMPSTDSVAGDWASGGSSAQPVQAASGDDPQVVVTLTQGSLFFSNFLVALILIGVPLIWVFFRHLMFEQARVAESDFAPVSSDDDEDDD